MIPRLWSQWPMAIQLDGLAASSASISFTRVASVRSASWWRLRSSRARWSSWRISKLRAQWTGAPASWSGGEPRMRCACEPRKSPERKSSVR